MRIREGRGTAELRRAGRARRAYAPFGLARVARIAIAALAVTPLLLVACGSDDTAVDLDSGALHEDTGTGAHVDGAASEDATLDDASTKPDAGPDAEVDAEPAPDAGEHDDAGMDATTGSDAADASDAAEPTDALPHDAAIDAHVDGGDASAHDAGTADAGKIKDAGAG